jgi:2-amino-4-hydroxy-6-hydroxymethyldihydropteridine diphosphokinase
MTKIKIFDAAEQPFMYTAYLLTGTNLGERKQHLARAKALIQELAGTISRSSALYETAAWGKTDQPSFLNQALELQTELDAPELMEQLLKAEKTIGRLRLEKYGPRIIDIDILLFGDQVIHQPTVIIPHPQLPNRRFALAPLAEIAAYIIHPVLKKTIQQLLEECSDPLEVARIGIGN